MLIVCLIVLIVFFFSRWLLRNVIKSDIKKLIAASLITISVAPLIYLAFVQILMFLITYSPERDFDRSEWFSEPQKRYQMGNDILENRLLARLDSVSVKELIGEPLRRRSVDRRGVELSWEFNMGTGAGGLGFLDHFLIIDFDRSGYVRDVRHAKVKS